jgi:hypothetical protein
MRFLPDIEIGQEKTRHGVGRSNAECIFSMARPRYGFRRCRYACAAKRSRLCRIAPFSNSDQKPPQYGGIP